MSEILYGKPVSESILNDLTERVNSLRQKGIAANITVVRLGEDPDDISYEKQVKKSCEIVGIDVSIRVFPVDISQDQLLREISSLNNDSRVHGVLLFRPLPSHINEDLISKSLLPVKDIDCMNPYNLGGVFTGDASAVPPCTPEAVITVLKHYGFDLTGKNVVIVNRSLVLGKPLSMLFLKENATVTVCHSRTIDLKSITRAADIVVTGIGKANYFNREYFTEDSIIADAGINFSDGKLTGDVDFEEVSGFVKAITPVPGGIGKVTTAILLRHLVQSAESLL